MSETHLSLRVSNLGPIEHADLGIRPLTVLIGKNNTGKTYLAQALYAAYKSVGEVRPNYIAEFSSEDIQALRNVMVHQSQTNQLVVPEEIHDKAYGWVCNAFAEAGNALENRMRAYFGLPDLQKIAQWGQQDPISVELFNGVSNENRGLLFGMNSKQRQSIARLSEIALDEVDDEILHMTRFLRENGDERVRETYTRELSWLLTREIWIKYLEDSRLYGTVHYLPAGRSGLLAAWTDVVKLRLQLERERFGLTKQPETSLGGVALDFISTLSDIINRNPRHSRYSLQLELFQKERDEPTNSLRLLQELMGGEVFAGSDEDRVPTLEYRDGTHRIPVQRASSMVADLAPLAMWIEHLLLSEDLLIVDEPESHLHPSTIRQVARVLVRLVNEGVGVVCATHSSVMLHELSNCVLRHEVQKKGHDDLDGQYPSQDSIDVDSVAVYRFHRSNEGEPVHVTPVEIEPEWGIPEDEYVKVSGDMSDESAKLINILAR